jgi:hypothetical protein
MYKHVVPTGNLIRTKMIKVALEDEIDIVAHGLLHEVDLGRVLGIAQGDHVVGRGIVIESEKEVERETGVELGETSPLHLEDMIGIEGGAGLGPFLPLMLLFLVLWLEPVAWEIHVLGLGHLATITGDVIVTDLLLDGSRCLVHGLGPLRGYEIKINHYQELVLPHKTVIMVM